MSYQIDEENHYYLVVHVNKTEGANNPKLKIRIYTDKNKEYLFIKDLDFKTLIINGNEINVRLPTNKLFVGNLSNQNNYILHCGNIKMPCMPEKKIKCIKL